MALHIKDHFTVVCSVIWPFNGSEFRGELALRQISLGWSCKCTRFYKTKQWGLYHRVIFSLKNGLFYLWPNSCFNQEESIVTNLFVWKPFRNLLMLNLHPSSHIIYTCMHWSLESTRVGYELVRVTLVLSESVFFKLPRACLCLFSF